MTSARFLPSFGVILLLLSGQAAAQTLAELETDLRTSVGKEIVPHLKAITDLVEAESDLELANAAVEDAYARLDIVLETVKKEGKPKDDARVEAEYKNVEAARARQQAVEGRFSKSLANLEEWDENASTFKKLLLKTNEEIKERKKTLAPTPSPAGSGASFQIPRPAPIVSAGPVLELPIKSVWAFDHLPHVQEIAVRNAAKSIGEESIGHAAEEVFAPLCILDHHFDEAARISPLKYAGNGFPLEDEGLLIYEGMHFTAYDDGTYEIKAVLGTPPVPVSFQLQLLLCEPSGRVHTLTLPPTTIPARDEDARPRQVYRRQHKFEHKGYLPLLATCDIDSIAIVRQGTARFGFGVNVP